MNQLNDKVESVNVEPVNVEPVNMDSVDSVDSLKETKPIKIKKHKCYECKVKLKMIIFTCKCDHIFCVKHLGGHTHNCTYDYVKEKKKQIEENNPKLGYKMVKI